MRMGKRVPQILDAIVDKVLTYHPKPVSKHQKKRRRKRGKLLAKERRKTA